MKIKLYPKSPVRVVISGPSGCGKTCLLTKLITEIINDYTEIYIYSPSIYQETYSKLIECFEKKIPPKSIPKVLNNNKLTLLVMKNLNLLTSLYFPIKTSMN